MLNNTTTPSLRSKVSHELKTPIASLTMLVHLLEKTSLSQEQQYFLRDINYLVEELSSAQQQIVDLIALN